MSRTTPSAHQTEDANVLPVGFQAIDTATLATAQALTVPDTARWAYIQSEGSDVRWRDDGTNPAAGAGGGMIVSPGPGFWYSGDLSAIRFIREDGAVTSLNVTYYA